MTDGRVTSIVAAGFMVALGSGLSAAAPLRAQTPAPPAGQPHLAVKPTGRIQVQFNTTSLGEDTAGVAASTFETRRVRLGADIEVGEWVRGRLEPEFALGRVRLADAWAAFEIDPSVTLRVGQFKIPFGLMELTSSTTHPMIERGVRIRGTAPHLESGQAPPPRWRNRVVIPEHYELLVVMGYGGRDLGASASGRVGSLHWEVGVFNGEGPDREDSNAGKVMAGRISAAPLGDLPLRIGIAAMRRDELSVAPASAARGDAVEVDLEWGAFRAPGLHLLAEVVRADNLASGETLAGAQLVGALYRDVRARRFEGVELTGRASWGDPDRTVSSDEGFLLTPGLNLYVQGRNRLMVNWDVFLPPGEDERPVHGLRAQAQLHF